MGINYNKERDFNRKTNHSELLPYIIDDNESTINRNTNKMVKLVVKHIMGMAKDLSTKGPLVRIIFTKINEDAFIKEIGFDRNKIIKSIKSSKAIDNNHITNNNPFYILIVCLIHYYYKNNTKVKKIDVASLLSMYLTIRIYKVAMSSSFPKYQPNERVMNYTIDHLNSNKYNIKKYGTMYKTLEYYSESHMTNFKDIIESEYDEHLLYFLSNQYGRIKQMMKTIATEYYKNHKEGNYESLDTIQSEDDEGGSYVNDNESVSSLIVSNTRRVYLQFISDTICNQTILKSVCKQTKVSVSKSTMVMNALHNNHDEDTKDLISNIFGYYFTKGGKTIKSAKFIHSLFDVYKQSNNNDKYIKRIKDLLNKLMDKYSDEYKKTSNTGTLNNFRKMLYRYMILYITDIS